jgi:hypothetical protein
MLDLCSLSWQSSYSGLLNWFNDSMMVMISSCRVTARSFVWDAPKFPRGKSTSPQRNVVHSLRHCGGEPEKILEEQSAALLKGRSDWLEPCPRLQKSSWFLRQTVVVPTRQLVEWWNGPHSRT